MNADTCSLNRPVCYCGGKEPHIYRIIRFRFHGKPRTIKNGLTLSAARLHCSSEKTHGPGWFDGYDLMKGVKA